MKGMPISLFFDAGEFNCPEKKSTNHGEHEPATRHLQQPHGQPRRCELVSWQMFPWRCGKRRGGYGGGGSSCWLLMLCVVGCVLRFAEEGSQVRFCLPGSRQKSDLAEVDFV